MIKFTILETTKTQKLMLIKFKKINKVAAVTMRKMGKKRRNIFIIMGSMMIKETIK
jgi:hypothetical protein